MNKDDSVQVRRADLEHIKAILTDTHKAMKAIGKCPECLEIIDRWEKVLKEPKP